MWRGESWYVKLRTKRGEKTKWIENLYGGKVFPERVDGNATHEEPETQTDAERETGSEEAMEGRSRGESWRNTRGAAPLHKAGPVLCCSGQRKPNHLAPLSCSWKSHSPQKLTVFHALRSYFNF